MPETPTGPAAFEVMGATAVTMPFSEVYSALQQNIVDAQENPLNLIVANKFYEVQNYVTITNHQYQAAYLLLDEKTYQNLTDIEKAAINEAAKETQVYESELLKADLEKSIKTLEENGVVIISPDIKEFAKTVEKAYQEYDMLMQAWIIKIKSLK
ncbi:MAG: TRAP-type transport system periplasmic protein [Clostridiales bacterium]|nr:TRAP-type transport system periplasmic protein [Clostridiales bacterium]